MKKKRIAILLLSMFLITAVAGGAHAALSNTYTTKTQVYKFVTSDTWISRDSGQKWYTFKVTANSLSYSGYTRDTAYSTPTDKNGNVGYANRTKITRGKTTAYTCNANYREVVNVYASLRNGYYTDEGITTRGMSAKVTFSGQY